MKRDEPFDPISKSNVQCEGLLYRAATLGDRDVISRLMAERNPHQEFSEILQKTDRELSTLATNSNYRLDVALFNGAVVGFCRYYHSSELSESRKIHPAPEGWYGMGIMVDSKMRRKGIARFLTSNRLKTLKENGVKEFYSIVDAKNLTSLHMHREFGFEEISRGTGFLHITLESGSGSLFRKLLNL